MNKLKFLYLLIFILNSCSMIKVADVDEDASPMRREKTQPFNDTVFELESILMDPAFVELQRVHAAFKEDKEQLGNKLSNQQIDEQNFHRQMDQLKDRFQKVKKSFKAQYRTHRLYSFLEVQNLIEKFRELQRAEELPLKIKYLSKKETYNRKQFERERIIIERKYEAIREFIRTFSQEVKATSEQRFIDDLQRLQQDYKNRWYNVKTYILPAGQETYEKELEFQEAERQLLQEHNQNYRRILEEFNQRSQASQVENVISRALQEQQENLAASRAVEDLASAHEVQQQQAKMRAIPKIRFSPSKL